MKKLCFNTRTWNRAEVLELTVESRASEIIKYGLERDVCIFIIDNHSDDQTPKVCKRLQSKYPFIVVWRSPEWKKQEEFFDIPAEVLKKIESEFYWFFGDDDILLKDTLPIVWKVLNSKEALEAVLIHSGHALLTPHSYKIYSGSISEFLNSMGYNQFIGWGASIILNHKAKLDILYSKFPEDFFQMYYKQYRTAAFSYVLAILHLHCDDKALVIDYPICKPLKHIDPKTAERWESENVGWRYFLFAKCLKMMYEEGILKKKLKAKFFKYLTYYLWERLLGEMIASRLGIYTRNPRPEEGWDYTLGIADIIDDEEVAEEIRTKVNKARKLCEEYEKIKKEIESKSSIKNNPKVKNELDMLILRSKKIKNELLRLYQECVTPIFKPGWAGEGMENRVLKL